MRLKSVKCAVIALLLLLLGAYLGFNTNTFGNSFSKTQEELFDFDPDARDHLAVPYPTRPKNEVIPTKSPEQIRELMLKYGARGAAGLEDHLPGPPDQPFGPESFDPDDKLKLEAFALKPEDLDPAPRLAGLPTMMPKLEGENIISMTLYGSILR